MKWFVGLSIVAIACVAASATWLLAGPPEAEAVAEEPAVAATPVAQTKPAASQPTGDKPQEAAAANLEGGAEARAAALAMINEWQHRDFVGILEVERWLEPMDAIPNGATTPKKLYVGANGEIRLDEWLITPRVEHPGIYTIAYGTSWMIVEDKPEWLFSIPYPIPEIEGVGEFDLMRTFSAAAFRLAGEFGCGPRAGEALVTVQDAMLDGDQLHAQCLVKKPVYPQAVPATLRGLRDAKSGRFLLSCVDYGHKTVEYSEFIHVADNMVLPGKIVWKRYGESEPYMSYQVTNAEARARTDFEFHNSVFPFPRKEEGGWERFPRLQTTFVMDDEGVVERQYWYGD
jgi:hypothetical protein